MADLRCPQCNSLNPGDAEKCWSCEAPLQSGESPESGEGSFDWLSNLRSGSDLEDAKNESKNEPEATASSDEDLPEWLRRVRQRSESERIDEEFSLDAEPADDDVPDWLKDLQGDPLDDSSSAPSEEDTIPPPASGLESQDWFQGLSDLSAGKASESDEESGVPEWLLEDVDETQPVNPSPPTEETAGFRAGDLPDWLAEPGIEDTSASVSNTAAMPAFHNEDLPDWLAEAGIEDTSARDSDAAEIPAFRNEGLPGWLAESGIEDTSAPNSDAAENPAFRNEGLPDWLAESGIEDTSASDSDAAEIPAFRNEDLPDWLAETPAEGQDETPAVQSSETAIYRPSQELPDWLSGLPGEIETEPDEQQPASDEPAIFSGSGLPDWLSAVSDENQPEVGSPVDDEAVKADRSDLPDWLAGSEVSPEMTPAQPSDADEVPSWLLSDEDEERQAEETSEWKPVDATASAEADSNWSKMFGSDDSAELSEYDLSPAELKPELEIEAAGPVVEYETETTAAEEDEVVADYEIEALPDWLSEESVDLPSSERVGVTPAFILDDEELEDSEIEQVHPFSAEDIPAWLADGEELASEEVESDDLTRTTLPNWVEAMRPVETVALGSAATSSEESHPEKAGPLTGLSGILPAEIVAIEYGRPPTYSMRLRVSDKQRASSALLETVLEEGSNPKELQREKPGTSQAIIRLLVGILLITVILLSGGLADVGSQPASFVSAINFKEQMESLPIDGSILLAADFDPGYSGELTLAGRGVIEDLLIRNNRLVVVSTSLAGPILAEELIQLARPNEMNLEGQTINLGYMPGGIISMKEFAMAPQIAARYGMDWVRTGQPAWQQPALQGVQTINDFSLVLVLTDSGDNGRMWLEQIKPDLGDVPIVMITTAQAAPILYPYFTGGQLDGLISGIAGGRSYNAQPNFEYESAWTAFRAGILVTIALMLLGILFRGISSLIPDPKA